MSDPHDPNPKQRRNWLREAWQREQDDTTTVFAVLMAGIAMLFVAGIVSAFMFAKNEAMEQNAERAAASATATATQPAPPAARSEPETTGTRPQHDPREDQPLERLMR